MSKKRQVQQAVVGYNLALKFGTMIIVSILCSLFAGIFLDKQLGTAPWLMLGLMLIGIVFSTYAIYRVASRMNESETDKEVD